MQLRVQLEFYIVLFWIGRSASVGPVRPGVVDLARTGEARPDA